MGIQLAANHKNISDRGFTLVEVLVAILILGLATSTFLGLQSSLLQRTYDDRNQRIAMLIARTILASAEVDPESFNFQTKKINAVRAIKETAGDYGLDKEDLADFLDFDVEIYAETIQVPILSGEEVQSTTMKRINVIVIWGDANYEKLDVVYFARLDTAEDDGSDDDDEDEEEG